jgi:hypothetical protein
MITNQYIRIVQGNIDLRSLANGYFSLINLGTHIDHEVYTKTVEKFVDLLEHGEDLVIISQLLRFFYNS